MNTKILALFLAAIGACQAADKLNIITSTQDLASLVTEVGGDHVLGTGANRVVHGRSKRQ